MTNREICIRLLNTMIENGYYLFSETPEHMVDRIGTDVKMWTEFYNHFMMSL